MLDTDSLATPISPTTTVGIAQNPLSERSAIGAAAEPIPFPVKQYQVIYADPPWHYFGDPNKDQAAGKHYDLMNTADIAALRVRSITAPSAALFLWATCPRLPEAIEVMAAWGFHYRGVHSVWVKTARDGHIIHGQGVRPTFSKPTAEFLLVGSTCRRGRPLPLLTEAQAQVVLAPRGRHSEKPSAFRDRIVELLGDVRGSNCSPANALPVGTSGATKSRTCTRRHDAKWLF